MSEVLIRWTREGADRQITFERWPGQPLGTIGGLSLSMTVDGQITASRYFVERTVLLDDAPSMRVLGIGGIRTEAAFRGRGFDRLMHETTCAVGLHIHSYRALWLFCFPEMIPHYERQGWVRLLSPEIVFIPEGGKKMFLPKDQIAALIYTDDGLDEEALRTSDELQVLGTPW